MPVDALICQIGYNSCVGLKELQSEDPLVSHTCKGKSTCLITYSKTELGEQQWVLGKNNLETKMKIIDIEEMVFVSHRKEDNHQK